jgi:2-amino-4-hydroxy-6-hydroxymethyldihydropteridine diphosphokinase
MIYLSLGSNIGDRKLHLETAIEAIQKFAEIKQLSSLYETVPLGFESDELFYNSCIGIECALSPIELLAEINKIELASGRVRFNDGKYHSRNLDIDILFYHNQVIQEENLTVPHPRIIERKFVLIPLFEIAPDLIHPKSNDSIAEILSKCKDNSELEKI